MFVYVIFVCNCLSESSLQPPSAWSLSYKLLEALMLMGWRSRIWSLGGGPKSIFLTICIKWWVGAGKSLSGCFLWSQDLLQNNWMVCPRWEPLIRIRTDALKAKAGSFPSLLCPLHHGECVPVGWEPFWSWWTIDFGSTIELHHHPVWVQHSQISYTSTSGQQLVLMLFGQTKIQ